MSGDPNGETYVIDFTETLADLNQVLAILEETVAEDLSYESLWENRIYVVRVHCGYDTFSVLSGKFAKAGLIPSTFAGPRFRVEIEPERIEPQA